MKNDMKKLVKFSFFTLLAFIIFVATCKTIIGWITGIIFVVLLLFFIIMTYGLGRKVWSGFNG